MLGDITEEIWGSKAGKGLESSKIQDSQEKASSGRGVDLVLQKTTSRSNNLECLIYADVLLTSVRSK